MVHRVFNPLFLSLFLFLSVNAFAQDYNYVEEKDEKKEEPKKEEKEPEKTKEEDPPSFKDRVFFGGNLGFQFGDITFIDISPLAGYKITNQLHAGIGVSYQYFKDSRFTNDYSSSILGYRTFGRYMVTENVFPHVEFESLSFKFQDNFGTELSRQWYNSLLAGVGIAQPIGRRGAINALVLYNLSYNSDEPSLYASPWITRIGFVF